MKFLLDTEVNLDVNDHFKSSDYVRVIKEAILNTPQHACFTIGLFGEWGTGKSSIVKTVRKQFEATSEQHIKFIEYDAWKYTNDSFRRTFLLRIQQELKFQPNARFLNFYSTRTTDVSIERKIDKRYLFSSLGIFLVGLICVLLIKGDPDIKITITIIVSAISALISWIGKAFNDHKISVVEPLIFAPEQFEECFSEMISLSLQKTTVSTSESKWVTGGSYLHAFEKIVIVIDNIDRCTKSTAYELITNIKNFLSKDHSVVFLIPVDDEALKKHILKDGDLRESEEFLRKFFNVTIRLKLFNRFDLYDYTAALIQKNGLEFSPTTIDIISKEYASTPRRIVQFINNLNAELLLFQNKYGNEFRATHESLICKLLVIREEWPSFYRTISHNPGVLNEQPEELFNIKKVISEDLYSFLTFTYSVNRAVPNETLEILLSAYDRTGGFAPHTLELVLSKDTESIKQLLNEQNSTADRLADKLIEMLEKGIRSGRYQLYVNHIFEMICNINVISPLSDDQNRRIFEQTRMALPKFMDYVEDLNTVCVYAQQIKQSFNYLHSYIEDQIKTNLESDGDGITPQYGSRLLEARINSIGNKEGLKQMAGMLSTLKLKTPIGLRNMKIDDDNLSYLATDSLIQNLLTAAKGISVKDEYFNDVLFLTQRVKLSASSVADIINFVEKMTSAPAVIHGQELDDHLSLINKLFFTQDPPKTETVNTAITNLLKLPELSRPLLASEDVELKANDDEILADFYLTCYKLSNESFDISKKLLSLKKMRQLRDHINEVLLKLKNDYGFHLGGLHEWILDDTGYTKSSLTLTKFVCLKEGNGALTDKELGLKMDNMLSDASLGDTYLFDFLLELAANPRIGLVFSNMMRRMPTESILLMSPSWLYTFCKDELEKPEVITSARGKNIVTAITSGTDSEQINHIGELILHALKREEKSAGQLDLIKAVRSLTPSHLSELSTIVSAMEDKVIQAEAGYYIRKLKGQNGDASELQPLEIIYASYGSDEGGQAVDVTNKLSSSIVNSTLNILVNNDLVDGADPHVGHVKHLNVIYAYKGETFSARIEERDTLNIPAN